MGTLANSEDPIEMMYNSAFHQPALLLLLRSKQPSGTEINHMVKVLKVQTLKNNDLFHCS